MCAPCQQYIHNIMWVSLPRTAISREWTALLLAFKCATLRSPQRKSMGAMDKILSDLKLARFLNSLVATPRSLPSMPLIPPAPILQITFCAEGIVKLVARVPWRAECPLSRYVGPVQVQLTSDWPPLAVRGLSAPGRCPPTRGLQRTSCWHRRPANLEDYSDIF